MSVESSSLEMAKLLISYGADVSQGNVLQVTVRSKKLDREPMLRYLLEQGAPVNALEHSANPRKKKIVAARHGVRTALHEAVSLGRWDLVRVLEEFHADWDIKDSNGISARELAQKTGAE
jgi:ankyrin repeat protein